MATTMAGLATAQSDMLISLAEEVDRQAATIAALTGERDYYRLAADNLTASVHAGWGRAHALGDELTTVRQVLETVKHDREKFMYGEAEFKAQVSKLYAENEHLRRELALCDQAHAEAIAAIERLRESGTPIIINYTISGPTEKEFAEKLYAELKRILEPTPDGPTPDMLAGRAHEILGTDPREMTQGWRA